MTGPASLSGKLLFSQVFTMFYPSLVNFDCVRRSYNGH